jgi:hypothetical protein
MAEDHAFHDELLGKTIADRYRIISRLGAGGMGVAYRAWDERRGVPVVIKIPKRAFLADPKFAERFYREIRLLQGLSHPYIVPIEDVGEHDGVPYVVLRFLPGGSLSNRRLRDEQGKPTANPAGMLHLWLPAIAAALDQVHAQGVVHRDVKPANIFFDAFWGAYLGDFGIAKIVEESDAFDREQTLTATHMGIGTPEYMSPEQFTPRATVDGRSDQYALAVTVYEMLAGQRPFRGKTAHLIVEVTTKAPPPLEAKRPDLPASLVAAVRKGLAKKPSDRFADCAAFAAAVLRDVPVLEDEPGVARLLCPHCSNILKLPVTAAGQKGKCPRCQTKMKVAEDLGALWLLDEARRQRQAVAEIGSVEEGHLPASEVAASDEEALAAFNPVSSTTPIGESYKWETYGPLPWVSTRWVPVACLVLAAWAGYRALGDAKPVPPPVPTYERQLESAWKTLKKDPTSPEANQLVGQHLCFKEDDWEKGLPHLARSGHVRFSVPAEAERAARFAKPPDPGAVIRIAHKWWGIANEPAFNTPESSAAIRRHAESLYRAQAEALTKDADITFANAWLDGDKAFRDAVGNTRPPQPQPVLAPDTLADKTLVVWLRLHNLGQRGGSALTIEGTNETFDGVVFGEAATARWFVGSEHFRRASPQPHLRAPEQEAHVRTTCLAIAYKGNRITMYRDGKVYADYHVSAPVAFRFQESRVVFGLRHTTAADRACLAADIDDARIYDSALAAEEIAALTPNVITGRQPIAWWHFNDGHTSDAKRTFPHTRFVGTQIRDGLLILRGRESFAVYSAEKMPAPSVPGGSAVRRQEYLSDLPAHDAVTLSADWPFSANGQIGNLPISIGGVKSPKGIGMHPPASGSAKATYDVPDGAQWLVARVGINDSGNSASPLTFRVVSARDGRTLWKSPQPLQASGSSLPCVANVSGEDRITLYVDCPGSPNWSHAVWLEPRFLFGGHSGGVAGVLTQPASHFMGKYGDSVGKTLEREVTGALGGGGVWGDNPYTADSFLAIAVVHAGILKPGQTGVVRVTVLPGQASYVGTTSNGVTSGSWGRYGLSYRVEMKPHTAEPSEGEGDEGANAPQSVEHEGTSGAKPQAEAPPVRPLARKPFARFAFDGNARNTGTGAAVWDLRNTEFDAGTLYLNGKYEYSKDPGYRAVCTTPGLDCGQFTVAVRVKPKLSAGMNVVVVGGSSYRWFQLVCSQSGDLALTLNNQRSSYRIAGPKLRADMWSAVVCSFDEKGKKVLVGIDGTSPHEIQLEEDFTLEIDLADEATRQRDKVWTFTNYSNGGVLHGYVDEMAIYNVALSAEDLRRVPLVIKQVREAAERKGVAGE